MCVSVCVCPFPPPSPNPRNRILLVKTSGFSQKMTDFYGILEKPIHFHTFHLHLA